MLRPRFLGSVLGLLAVSLLAFSASPQRSPLQTIELLHKAFRDADAAAVGLLLHEEYRGVSLQGAPDHRQIYVETQAKAMSGGELGLFVRSIVGLDRRAAKRAFDGFLTGKALTANQIQFVNLVIDRPRNRYCCEGVIWKSIL